MALVLIKEDGSGLANANAYADAADGDAYHLGHLYATAWTAAVAGDKDKALVMATRLIDASYQFNGFRKSDAQALQWPRYEAIDPDRADAQLSVLDSDLGVYFDSDSLPAILAKATCELARELLVADRTGAPDGEGINTFTVGGALSIIFDKTDRRSVIPQLVQAMLAKLGSYIGRGGGSVKLTRT